MERQLAPSSLVAVEVSACLEAKKKAFALETANGMAVVAVESYHRCSVQPSRVDTSALERSELEIEELDTPPSFGW
jgi:hypothetical protein